MKTKKSLLLKDTLLPLDSTVVMGIINLTNDSFYSGSRVKDQESVYQKVEEMIIEGCDIIDLGAQSTRPNATFYGKEHELKVLLPIIKFLKKKVSIPLSVDTFRSEVAYACIEEGIDIVNDVTGGQYDNKMFKVLSDKTIPFICNHLKGDIQNMQSKENTTYPNIEKEVIEYFIKKKKQCYTNRINDIILDIGFGFSKNMIDNYKLLSLLPVLNSLFTEPIMVGLSRKSSIYKLLSSTPEDALHGTDALHTIAVLNGVDILRTHDVKACRDVIKIAEYYKNNSI